MNSVDCSYILTVKKTTPRTNSDILIKFCIQVPIEIRNEQRTSQTLNELRRQIQIRVRRYTTRKCR